MTTYDENDAREMASSMGMVIYHIFFLKKGSTWTAEETPEVLNLQKEHLANLRRLGEMGKLVLNGPLLDSFAVSGEIRGVGVLKAETMTEACELLDTDPMVKVGRLVYEVHAWMVGRGILP